MSKAIERGAAAERLRNDETFQDVLREVREAQVAVFLDARTSQDAREEAHVNIRALAKIEGVIDARCADATFEQNRKSAP